MDYITFSQKFTPYGWFPDFEFFVFISAIPILLLLVKAFRVFIIQTLINIWYTGWILMAGWDFYLERAQTNVNIFVIICVLYFLEVIYVIYLAIKRFKDSKERKGGGSY